MQSSVLNALTIASYLIGGYYCFYLSDEESERLGLWVLSLLRDKDLGSSVRALKGPSVQEKKNTKSESKK